MNIPNSATFSNATEVVGPGDYFVSAIDGDRYWLMAGPYPTYAEADAIKDKARDITNEHDGRAWFMAWGVCRKDVGCGLVGNLNKAGLL